eukprot:TRINITY_DN14788_c0_g1_i1.p1 TRINITY_DN14788_c0_g1~~TRINITY_DN14788_c0_g1_i1.p1  ORF type:complete len:105 (+),score=5.35 TRINITY_DN14788_c0_g1_i1:301-615(+)
MVVIAEYFCSALCPSCQESIDQYLLPCADLCSNYTQCREEFTTPSGRHCLPPAPYPCHLTAVSTDEGSELVCTYLSADFDHIPDDLDSAVTISNFIVFMFSFFT